MFRGSRRGLGLAKGRRGLCRAQPVTRRLNKRGFVSLFYNLKLQSSVLELVAGLGKLLGPLGCEFGHLLYYLIPKYPSCFLY